MGGHSCTNISDAFGARWLLLSTSKNFSPLQLPLSSLLSSLSWSFLSSPRPQAHPRDTLLHADEPTHTLRTALCSPRAAHERSPAVVRSYSVIVLS
jgi:hypothetical protein